MKIFVLKTKQEIYYRFIFKMLIFDYVIIGKTFTWIRRYICVLIFNNMYLRKLSLSFLLLMPFCIMAQKATISGYVKDSSNGEGLIGASVYIKELKTGNVTNTYGFYSLSVQPGEFTLVFSFNV
jgi:hypothetical protein